MSVHKPEDVRSHAGPRTAYALIIDDDRFFAAFLEALLKRIGFSVVSVRTGEEGLAQSAACRPDLVFLDWVFPNGMSGEDALGRLKTEPATANVPVVVISAEPASPLEEPAMKALGASLFMPKNLVSDSARQPLALRERLRALIASAPTSGRILVVEDDPGFQEFVGCVLSKRGYEITTAANGREGLSLARRRRPDLILLDLTIPGLNGVEVYQLLKAEAVTRPIPVLMMTAMEDPSGIIQSSVDLFAPAGFLKKPFGENEILLQVRRLLGGAAGGSQPPAAERVLIQGRITLDLDLCRLTIGDATPRTIGPKRCDLLGLLLKTQGGLSVGAAVKQGWEPASFRKTLQRLRRDLGGRKSILYRNHAYYLSV